VHYGLATNGTLLTAEAMSRLKHYGIHAHVSIDGPAHLHDRYRKFPDGTGTYGALSCNLSEIWKTFCDESLLTYSVVLAPPVDVREIVDFFASGQPAPFRVTNVSPVNRGFEDVRLAPALADGAVLGFPELEEEYLRALERGAYNSEGRAANPRLGILNLLFGEFFRRIVERNRSVASTDSGIPDQFYPGTLCLPGVRKLMATADGRYLLCERVEDRCTENVIGFVETGVDFEKAFALFQSYVRLTAEECRNCWALRMCPAPCAAFLYSNGRLSRERKLRGCETGKKGLERALVLMHTILESSPDAFNFILESARLHDESKTLEREKELRARKCGETKT
jgi:uncharacterized protein